MYFFKVFDKDGEFGYFQFEQLAEKCANYYEQLKYNDEQDKVHVYIWRYSFNDRDWQE